MGLGSFDIIGQRGVIVALISRSRPRRPAPRGALVLAVTLALAPRAEAYVFWTNSGDTIGRANLDGTGVDPSFITLVGANPYLSGVAVDARHVYWSDFNTGAIGRANLDGTGVDREFITGAGPTPSGVTVDGGHVYWTNPDGIGRANLDGTGVDRSFISGGSFLGVSEPRGPAVDAAHIYWGDIGPAPTTIGRANLDGTGVEGSFIEFPLDRSARRRSPSLSRSTATTSTGRTWATVARMERSGAPASTARG